MPATFGGLELTNIGKNLYLKAQLGKVLKIVRIELGDGSLDSTENMLDLTGLKNKVLDCNILELKVIKNNIAEIIFSLNSQNLEQGFYWREIGIIAQDPDTRTRTFILLWKCKRKWRIYPT